VVECINLSIGFLEYKVVVTGSSTIMDAGIINTVDNYVTT